MADRGEEHGSSRQEIAELPRIGVSLVLSEKLEDLKWFGRGPWESYDDARPCTTVGVYSRHGHGPACPLYVAAGTRPQDRDAMAFALRKKARVVLKVVGQPLIDFSVSHMTGHDLYQSHARK